MKLTKKQLEMIQDLYTDGYKKEFIYQYLKDKDNSVRRKDVRNAMYRLDDSEVLRDVRNQYKSFMLEKNRKEKGYIKARESGKRYREFEEDEDLEIIKKMYPEKF